MILTLLAVAGLWKLQFDDQPRRIYRSDDADHALLQQTLQDFGSDDNDCLLVLEQEHWLHPQGLKLLSELPERIAPLPGVESVVSLAQVPIWQGGFPQPLVPVNTGGSPPKLTEALRQAILQHPLVPGRLLSEDQKTALALVRLQEGRHRLQDFRPVVEGLQLLAEELSRQPGLKVRVTGIPAIRVEIYETAYREQVRFATMAAVWALVVASLLFRRPQPALLCFFATCLAAIWATGLLGWLGQEMNLLLSILPSLVMIIAFTDTVHLAMDMARSRYVGMGPAPAGSQAIFNLGRACLLTSLTTAAGFGSLMISRIAIIADFGMVSAMAVILAFLAVVIAAPWLSTWKPLHIPPPRHLQENRTQKLLTALADAVLKRPAKVALLGVLLTLFLFWVAMQNQPQNRLSEASPQAGDTFQALMHCDQAFGGIQQAAVLVQWPPDMDAFSSPVQKIQRQILDFLEADPFYHAAIAPLSMQALLPNQAVSAQSWNWLPETFRRRWLRPDLRQALIRSRTPDAASQEADQAFQRLETKLMALEAEYPGFDLALTGTCVVARRNIQIMVVDFARGLGLAAFVIFMVISISFRSFKLGLLSLLPNAFPLVCAASMLVFLDIPLQISSAVALTVCLGVAVDDTIHFLSRFQKEWALDHQLKEALKRTYVAVGRALVVTTLVLAGGFSMIMASEVPTTRLMGLLTSSGIVAALFGDLVLLPALLAAFYRPRKTS